MSATCERMLLPEMGSCATRIDADADEVELGCLTNVGIPLCASAVLEGPQTHERNPETAVPSIRLAKWQLTE
jgi:hypothetical protein